MGEAIMNMLAGQTAIVFGATGRVGPAVCGLLARYGAAVMVHCNRSVDKAESIVSELRRLGADAEAIQADACDEEMVKGVYRRANDTFNSIDIVVNHIHRDSENSPARVGDMEWTDWNIHLDALKAHFLICKHALPYMRERRYGRIIYISGGLAFRFYRGLSAYTTIKAGLNGFCKTLALEEGENNITVNVVSPGKVQGHAPERRADGWDNLDDVCNCPLGRFASPEDVANAVLTFALPGSSNITGQTLYVSGGEIMPMP
jgi:3-oxoacyl-[acyl-carrier protein] reductase